MRIITVADDGTVTVELAADEARDVHTDLDNAPWKTLTAAGRNLFHHLRSARRPTPTGSH